MLDAPDDSSSCPHIRQTHDQKIEIDFHGRPLSVEIGRVAKQADGAALVRYATWSCWSRLSRG
jgi:hypothetical protein